MRMSRRWLGAPWRGRCSNEARPGCSKADLAKSTPVVVGSQQQPHSPGDAVEDRINAYGRDAQFQQTNYLVERESFKIVQFENQHIAVAVSPTDGLSQGVLDFFHRVERLAPALRRALYPGSLGIHGCAVSRENLIQRIGDLRALEGFHFTEMVANHINRDHHQVLVNRIVVPAFESLERLAAVINQAAVNSLNKVLSRVIGELLSTIYFLPRFASKCFQDGGSDSGMVAA